MFWPFKKKSDQPDIRQLVEKVEAVAINEGDFVILSMPGQCSEQMLNNLRSCSFMDTLHNKGCAVVLLEEGARLTVLSSKKTCSPDSAAT